MKHIPELEVSEAEVSGLEIAELEVFLKRFLNWIWRFQSWRFWSWRSSLTRWTGVVSVGHWYWVGLWKTVKNKVRTSVQQRQWGLRGILLNKFTTTGLQTCWNLAFCLRTRTENEWWDRETRHELKICGQRIKQTLYLQVRTRNGGGPNKQLAAHSQVEYLDSAEESFLE